MLNAVMMSVTDASNCFSCIIYSFHWANQYKANIQIWPLQIADV